MDSSNHKMCPVTGKVSYSQKEAGCVINDVKKFKNHNRGKNITQRCYKCQFCGYWHLTHFRNLRTCKRTLGRCGPRGHKEIPEDFK